MSRDLGLGLGLGLGLTVRTLNNPLLMQDQYFVIKMQDR